MKQVAAED